MTPYQLLDGFEINGKEKKYDLDFKDVGDVIAVHVKSFYGPKLKPKQLLIDEITCTVTPPESSKAEPVDYVFKNLKKIKISKSVPTFAINIDGEKPKQ